MIQFLENQQWVKFDNMEQVYSLFITQPNPPFDMLYSMHEPRVHDIILDDGTVITKEIAIVKYAEIQLQKFLDSKAKEKGYDSILSASSYASVDNPFKQEAIDFLNWRSACWTKAYEILNALEANNFVDIPTMENFLGQMPELIFT